MADDLTAMLRRAIDEFVVEQDRGRCIHDTQRDALADRLAAVVVKASGGSWGVPEISNDYDAKRPPCPVCEKPADLCADCGLCPKCCRGPAVLAFLARSKVDHAG